MTLREQMRHVTDVGYRVGLVAEPACTIKGAAFGMSLDFIEAYDARDRDAVIGLLKMGDYPQIAAVAAGSPAQKAGLRPGDDLLAIDGADTLTLLADSSQKMLFADELEKKLMQKTPGTTSILTVRRDGTVLQTRVMPVRACAARVVIKTGLGITAFSDGTNIAVSGKLVGFALDDDELALIVGHELGHIINNDGDASSLHQRRNMEDRADARGVQLVKCAGYDVEKSLQFWLRRDAQDWFRLLRDPTHRSRKKRVELMRKEATVATCPIEVVR